MFKCACLFLVVCLCVCVSVSWYDCLCVYSLPPLHLLRRQFGLYPYCYNPQRLERLLGVSGPNAKKKRAKLEREIEEEDGMGDEFGAFLSDLDRIGDVRGSSAC